MKRKLKIGVSWINAQITGLYNDINNLYNTFISLVYNITLCLFILP